MLRISKFSTILTKTKCNWDNRVDFGPISMTRTSQSASNWGAKMSTFGHYSTENRQISDWRSLVRGRLRGPWHQNWPKINSIGPITFGFGQNSWKLAYPKQLEIFRVPSKSPIFSHFWMLFWTLKIDIFKSLFLTKTINFSSSHDWIL